MRPRIVSMIGAGAVALSGCNTGGSTTLASMFVASQEVQASAGGTVTVSSSESSTLAGASVQIPPNALSVDTRITIGYGGGTSAEYTATPSATASIAPSTGKAAGPVVFFGPDGTAFHVPVTLTLPFTLPAGAQQSQLVIYALEGNNHSYQINDGLQVSGGFVTFSASGFTQFQAGVGETIPPPPDDGGVDAGADAGMDGGVDAGPDGGPDSGIDGGGGCGPGQTVQPDGGCCWGTLGQGPCGIAGVNGNADCCEGFVCGSSNFCVTAPGFDGGSGEDGGGCPVADAGQACDVSTDCNQNENLVCAPTGSDLGPAGQGTCNPAATVPTSCSSATVACGGATDKPCCGLCVNGFCQDLGNQTCSSISGSTCSGDADCCTGFKCAAGTCQPSCGGAFASCASNADCCTNLGYVCTGAPPFCQTLSNAAQMDCSPNKCGPNSDAGECLLGTPCIPVTVSGAAGDSCMAAGLVCDSTLEVCRNPNAFDPCLPGGPACNELTGTNANSWQCVSEAPLQGIPPLCLELCGTNADCLYPFSSCSTTPGGNMCFANANPACTDFFGTCNAGGTNDGICFQVYNAQGNFSSCYQAISDGGGPGTACDVNATRQNPSFCDTSDICLAGICQPICDTAGSAGHLCPTTSTNAMCLQDPDFGSDPSTGMPITTLGACAVKCDFTDPNGSNCTTTDAGVPSKCLPGKIAQTGYPDDGTGFCVAAPANPIAAGQPCTPGGTYLDPCAVGTICYSTPAMGSTCTALCTNVGLLCSDGVKTCTALAAGDNNTGVCL